jgi:hypothetical protein
MKYVCIVGLCSIVFLFSDCGEQKNSGSANGAKKQDTAYLNGDDSVIVKAGDTVIMDLGESHILPMK